MWIKSSSDALGSDPAPSSANTAGFHEALCDATLESLDLRNTWGSKMGYQKMPAVLIAYSTESINLTQLKGKKQNILMEHKKYGQL